MFKSLYWGGLQSEGLNSLCHFNTKVWCSVSSGELCVCVFVCCMFFSLCFSLSFLFSLQVMSVNSFHLWVSVWKLIGWYKSEGTNHHPELSTEEQKSRSRASLVLCSWLVCSWAAASLFKLKEFKGFVVGGLGL